jgi:exonuclease VII small subunit
VFSEIEGRREMENNFEAKLKRLQEEGRLLETDRERLDFSKCLQECRGGLNEYEAETRLLPWRLKLFEARFQKVIKECQEILKDMREAVESLEKVVELAKIEKMSHSYRDLGMP